MRLIKKMVDQIKEEIHGAGEYLDCAFNLKQEYPKLSQSYYDLAQDELVHIQTLHNGVVALIEETKKKVTPPPFMMELWEEEHVKLIDKTAKLKHKMTLYK